MDDDTIKENLHKLDKAMSGMVQQEVSRIIYPVCTLCQDHQRSSFVDGVKVEIRLCK